ncbi:MAG: M15 family metallopeptidase [Candidatus Saccharibacteria bacterium]
MAKHNFIGIGLVAVTVIASLSWGHIKHPTKESYSTTDPNSIWVVVNKKLALPNGFAPYDLVVPNVSLRLESTSMQMQVRQVIKADLEAMFAAAKKEGHSLMLSSGYRSVAYQKSLYDGYVVTQGLASADRSSARPGHSEHQTGLAFDVEPSNKRCELEQCFGDTPEGKWLAEHAANYGFIIRYGKDQEQLTGYEYEPWHLRYVGKNLASELVINSKTLEQYFNIEPALKY